jgi:TRAP-type uncharacterized transport system substrate-binding protein
MSGPLRFLGWGVSNWQAAFEWIVRGMKERRPDLEIAVLGPAGPRMEALAAGEVDAAITTPTADAAMALKGLGPHSRPLPGLRAIAALPHRDRMLLTVQEDIAAKYDLHSMRDLVDRRAPLRLAGPERDGDSPSFAVEQLLALHGATRDDLARWGGGWTEMAAPMPGPDLLSGGGVDGIFNEAYMLLHTLPEDARIRVLPPDPDALAALTSRFGYQTACLERGEFPGLDRPLTVLDFSDWVVMVRVDMPSEVAELMARVVIEDRATFEARYAHTPLHLSAVYYPLRPELLCRTGDVPLHPAAEAYYRDIGVL